jgi:hypothetical protein
MKDIEDACSKVRCRADQMYKAVMSAGQAALARDAGGNDRGAIISMKRYRMSRAMYEHLCETVLPAMKQLEIDARGASNLVDNPADKGLPIDAKSNVDVSSLWSAYRQRLDDLTEKAKAAPISKLSTSVHGEDALGTDSLLTELRFQGGSFLDDFVASVKAGGKTSAPKFGARALVRKQSDISHASFADSFSADTFVGDFEDFNGNCDDDTISDNEDDDSISMKGDANDLDDDDDSIVLM